MKTYLFLALCLLPLSAHTEPTPVKSGLQSLVLPGWGQFSNQEPAKGCALGISTLALFGGTVATYYLSGQAEERYLGIGVGQPQGTFDSAYTDWENMTTLNHSLFIGWIILHSWTAIDAIVGAKTHQKLQGRVRITPGSAVITLASF